MSDEKNIGIHAGHKRRLREKFALRDNFENFEDHEILELLLCYSNIRQNTNETSHRLLETFGSLYNVFNAPRIQLLSVEGVGERMATFLIMQRALFGVYQQRKHEIIDKPPISEDLMPHIISLFETEHKEAFYMICITKQGVMMKPKLMMRGSSDTLLVDTREVIKEAINVDAIGVIFAHNHPTGILEPSNEDINTTRILFEGLRAINIELVDHYIVARNSYTSILSDFRCSFFLKKR